MKLLKAAAAATAAIILLCSCAAQPGPTPSVPGDEQYMAQAGQELMDILWNIDYETFTAEETTKFAKKYYDSEYLASYLEDEELRSGVYSAQEEKLKAGVISTEVLEYGEETFEDGETYKTLKIRVNMKLESYKPVNPEDSFFEEGREYTLDYTLYFKTEKGALKLSGFEYEPVGQPFLPKRAQNVPLTASEQAAIAEVARSYYQNRYEFDYHSYDPEEAFKFYEENMNPLYREKQGITLDDLTLFSQEIGEAQLCSSIESLDLGSLPINKEDVIVDDFSEEFYYVVHASVKYSLTGSNEYCEITDMENGQTFEFSESLCFEFQDGRPLIAYAAYDEEDV